RVFVGLDVVTDVEEDDVSTFLGQLDGMAAALTAGASGNQDDFAFYASHPLRHAQRAFHIGNRFSAKANGPSLASSDFSSAVNSRVVRSHLGSSATTIPSSAP